MRRPKGRENLIFKVLKKLDESTARCNCNTECSCWALDVLDIVQVERINIRDRDDRKKYRKNAARHSPAQDAEEEEERIFMIRSHPSTPSASNVMILIVRRCDTA